MTVPATRVDELEAELRATKQASARREGDLAAKSAAWESEKVVISTTLGAALKEAERLRSHAKRALQILERMAGGAIAQAKLELQQVVQPR